GLRVVAQARGRGVARARAEIEDLGADEPEMQIGGCGARPAVKYEGDRPAGAAALEYIGGVEDGGGALAALFVNIERAGGRPKGEIHNIRLEGVFGRRMGRQQREDAGPLRALL